MNLPSCSATTFPKYGSNSLAVMIPMSPEMSNGPTPLLELNGSKCMTCPFSLSRLDATWRSPRSTLLGGSWTPGCPLRVFERRYILETNSSELLSTSLLSSDTGLSWEITGGGICSSIVSIASRFWLKVPVSARNSRRGAGWRNVISLSVGMEFKYSPLALRWFGAISIK